MTMRSTWLIVLCVLMGTDVTLGQDEAGARAQGRRNGEAVRRAQERAQERARRARETARERQEARQGPALTEPFSRTVKLGREGTFELVNVSGRVTLTGTGSDDVRVDAVRRVWHQNEDEAKALMQELEVRISEGPGRVGIRTVFPRQRSYDAEVEYTIAVPQGAQVSIQTAAGDIIVSNLRGELRATTVSGSVSAMSVGDVRQTRAVSGNVTIDGASGAEVAASTIGGAVTVRRAKARSIDLRSVGGAVRIADSESDRVSAQTVSGSIEYAGRIGRNGRYDLASRSGAILVTPTGNDGFEIEVTTLRGELRSDFPLTLQEQPRGGGVSRQPLTRVTRGVVGDGGGLVTLRSMSGSLTITKR